MFEFKRAGEAVKCEGKGFTYERVGYLSRFAFSGKIPSRRNIRTIVKALEHLTSGDL